MLIALLALAGCGDVDPVIHMSETERPTLVPQTNPYAYATTAESTTAEYIFPTIPDETTAPETTVPPETSTEDLIRTQTVMDVNYKMIGEIWVGESTKIQIYARVQYTFTDIDMMEYASKESGFSELDWFNYTAYECIAKYVADRQSLSPEGFMQRANEVSQYVLSHQSQIMNEAKSIHVNQFMVIDMFEITKMEIVP